MSEGGEARNHEAEVQAVAEELRDAEWARSISAGGPHEQSIEWARMRAEAVVATLDAVRCAQGRDTDAPERHEILSKACAEGTCGCKAREGIASEGGTANPRDLATAAPSLAPQGEDHGLREKIADELTYNDECGSRHLASRAEYLADADAILRIVGEHERLGELLDGETK